MKNVLEVREEIHVRQCCRDHFSARGAGASRMFSLDVQAGLTIDAPRRNRE